MSISDYGVPIIGGAILMTLCWLFGRLGFSFVWVVFFVVLSVLKTKLWRQREKRVLALQQAALREKEVVMAQLRDLPAWVQFPDTERVEWMNRVIYQMWPYASEFGKKFIKDFIEPQMRAHMPGPFKSITIESMDMGDIPLRVGGIKVYTENVGRDRIIMDMDVAYAGDLEIMIRVGAFKAGLRQLQFKGKVRTVLKPLLPRPPLIGAISVFFLNEPDVDFDLIGLGELVELPGLLGAVRTIINSQLASICVLPNEIVVPLTSETDIVTLYFPEPDGVVAINVLEAKNLEHKDGFRGKSDPYANITVGGQAFKTKTINSNLNPVWDEYFEAVVDQAFGQRINVEMYDEDIGSTDDFLGRTSIDLAPVRNNGIVDDWFPLETVKQGDLHMRLVWYDLTTEMPAGKINQEATIENESDLNAVTRHLPSTALLMIYIDCAENLPAVRKNMEPTPFVELTIGKITQRTYPRPKTHNPLYRVKFVFFVTNVDTQTLKLEAKDESAGYHSLGEAIFPIRNLLKEDRMELYQHKINLALGPNMSTVVATMRLRYLRRTASKAPIDTMDTKLIEDAAETPAYTTTAAFVSQPGNQTVLPPVDLENILTKDEAWRDIDVSPGAITPDTETKQNFATRAFDKLVHSNSILGGKLRHRRKKTYSVSDVNELGYLEASISYHDIDKRLVVIVHRIKALKAMNPDNVADPYANIRLLHNGLLVAKSKTDVQRGTLDPVFDQKFEFDVMIADFHQFTLVFDVKDAMNYGWFSRAPIFGQVICDLAILEKTRATKQWFALSYPR